VLQQNVVPSPTILQAGSQTYAVQNATKRTVNRVNFCMDSRRRVTLNSRK